jgi:hypothetical protein
MSCLKIRTILKTDSKDSGFFSDSIWILFEIYSDSIWILFGFYSDLTVFQLSPFGVEVEHRLLALLQRRVRVRPQPTRVLQVRPQHHFVVGRWNLIEEMISNTVKPVVKITAISDCHFKLL